MDLIPTKLPFVQNLQPLTYKETSLNFTGEGTSVNKCKVPPLPFDVYTREKERSLLHKYKVSVRERKGEDSSSPCLYGLRDYSRLTAL